MKREHRVWEFPSEPEFIEHGENIHSQGDDWYFADETGDPHGPYKTKQEAKKACDDWVKVVIDGANPITGEPLDQYQEISC
jgi:hypothetical protein